MVFGFAGWDGVGEAGAGKLEPDPPEPCEDEPDPDFALELDEPLAVELALLVALLAELLAALGCTTGRNGSRESP